MAFVPLVIGPKLVTCEFCDLEKYYYARLLVSRMYHREKRYCLSSGICKECYKYVIDTYEGKGVIIHDRINSIEISKRYHTNIRKHFQKENANTVEPDTKEPALE